MNKYSNPSYNTNNCCGADCCRYGWDEDEPCWGDVSVVGEVLNYEGDYEWIHACEGHYDVLSQDENKQYVKEAPAVQTTV